MVYCEIKIYIKPNNLKVFESRNNSKHITSVWSLHFTSHTLF